MKSAVHNASAWFQKNSQKLAKTHKNKWLAISAKGVIANSTSYSKAATAATGTDCILVKIPKKPQMACVY
ncbi:MAG: hypothetical protein WC607_04670 [Candidatus Micrarchaeia archaeon]